MDFIIAIVLFVDSIMATKILGSMVRAKFRKCDYMDNLFWTRIGFLVVFHVVMLVISGFTLYIGAIVRATL